MKQVLYSPGKNVKGTKWEGEVKSLIFPCFEDVESVRSFILPGKKRQGNKVGAWVKRLIIWCLQDVESVTSFL